MENVARLDAARNETARILMEQQVCHGDVVAWRRCNMVLLWYSGAAVVRCCGGEVFVLIWFGVVVVWCCCGAVLVWYDVVRYGYVGV